MSATGADLRVAIVGLATSHPFTDALALRELALERGRTLRIEVSDDDPTRRDEFLAQHGDIACAADPGSSRAPSDLVIITLPPPRIAAHVRAALDAGSPCYVNKPAAVTRRHVELLDAAVRDRERLFLTASTLRFASVVPSSASDRGVRLLARATVRHDVGRWARGAPSWQADRSIGGGLIGTMGVHGLELLSAVLGHGFVVDWVSRARRSHHALEGEDVAVIGLRWPDGLVGTVELLGSTAEPGYAVTVMHRDGDTRVLLPSDAKDPYGTRATMSALLAMVDGAPSPVPWAESRDILTALADAVAFGESDDPVYEGAEQHPPSMLKEQHHENHS